MQPIWEELTGEELRFYGEQLPWLVSAMEQVLGHIEQWRLSRRQQTGQDPLLYTTRRIKSAESMRQKLERLGEAPSAEAALTVVHDAAGVRAVCLFVDEVYELVKVLEKQQDVAVLQIKDYIAYPKPSGYRSCHLILEQRVLRPEGQRPVVVEVQLRTVAMDTWAALEHEIQYKKEVPEQALLCA